MIDSETTGGKIKLENPSNACVRLELSDCILLCDPWFTKGIYDGGWANFPKVKYVNLILKNITHIFISHIHEDHFDITFLSTLDKDIQIILPDMFPNHIIEKNLRNIGFSDIVMVPFDKVYNLTPNVSLDIIPPMNGFAQELSRYTHDTRPITACDAGCLIYDQKVKIVLLSDNTPYNENDAGRVKDKMKDVDLLAFPYNGAASDYPICYDFTREEMIEISNRREQRREIAISKFLKKYNPKLSMPYSSDFMVMGPSAKKFSYFENEYWVNKKAVAEYYKKNYQIETTYLYEGDYLLLDESSHELKHKENIVPKLSEYLTENHSDEPYTREKYKCKSSYLELLNKTKLAALNMFKKMDENNFKSNWVLKIDLTNTTYDPIFIDLDERTIKAAEILDKKTLTCKIESGYYESILDRNSHWNNAQLSFQLKWNRTPNEFDMNLYASINFFHIPVVK